MTVGWETALDLLEERLRRQEAVVAMRSEVPPEEDLPAVEGPLPAELGPRALALLQRSHELELAVEARLARVAPRPHSYGGAGDAGGGTDHGAL